jgi:cytochrome c
MSFEFNKILGAILGTCLFVLVLNITAHALFTPAKPAKPGYEIAVQEEAPSQQAAAAAQSAPIETLLASATAERGETVAKQCASCHTFGKGEPNKVGPNLYGVVGRPHASVPGFNYSAAMKARGGEWTVQELNAFIANPKGTIPGTAMAYAGLGRDTARADLIAFLNSKSDSPKPLPTAAAGGNGGQPAPQPANSGAQRPGTQPAETPRQQ